MQIFKYYFVRWVVSFVLNKSRHRDMRDSGSRNTDEFPLTV